MTDTNIGATTAPTTSVVTPAVVSTVPKRVWLKNTTREMKKVKGSDGKSYYYPQKSINHLPDNVTYVKPLPSGVVEVFPST